MLSQNCPAVSVNFRSNSFRLQFHLQIKQLTVFQNCVMVPQIKPKTILTTPTLDQN